MWERERERENGGWIKEEMKKGRKGKKALQAQRVIDVHTIWGPKNTT